MHFLRIESTQKSSNKRPATSTYSVREASQSKPFFSRCAMRPCGHTRPPHPHLAWVWLTWSFAFSTAFWLFCAAPGKAFDHFSHGWQGNDFLKETGKKNQSQRKIFGKSSFWNNSCIYLMCCYLFFFFSVWNFGNFPTQLSTTKKMDRSMSTFISFSMDAFSFKQMSKSSWASALVRAPRPLELPGICCWRNPPCWN